MSEYVVHDMPSFSYDKEFQRIRDIILHKQANLTRLDLEISRLLAERAEEQESLRSHKLLMAPVRRLPLELLSEIFLRCLDEEPPVTPRSLQAPLLLTRVSRTWRKVALATPKLWSSINLGLFSLHAKSRQFMPLLMEMWLARSGTCPLTITLGLRSDEAPAIAALAVMYRYMDRWQHVKLDWIQNPNLPARILNLSRDHELPLLETFDLRTVGGVGEEQLTAMLPNACSLRRFSWSDTDHSIIIDPTDPTRRAHLNLQWDQLSHLTLRCKLSLRDCVGILHMSPNLESCRFDLVRHESQAFTMQGHINLPRLHQFSINSTFELSALFDRLTVPALRDIDMTLEYDGDDAVPAWSQPHFTALLVRSSCALERLAIHGALSEDDLIACLERTSTSLVHLCINNQLSRAPCITDRILRLLKRGSSDDGRLLCLCPRLQRIIFRRCMKYNHSISAGLLADMIESRWRVPPASKPDFRSASLNSNPNSDSSAVISARVIPVAQPEFIELTLSASAISMDDVTRLHAMRREGLDIQFSFTG